MTEPKFCRDCRHLDGDGFCHGEYLNLVTGERRPLSVAVDAAWYRRNDCGYDARFFEPK